MNEDVDLSKIHGTGAASREGPIMMIQSGPEVSRRLREIEFHTDLVIVGGGLAGTCAAITAARAGTRVLLIQDRPVLGGNASSEVRLWILGATSHMGNNNRWAREGGVVDEILIENLYRNPEGNPLILDTILLEKVTQEPKITLLLNTAVYEVIKGGAETIDSVTAFCSQNQTLYRAHAPLFCDASGDGILGLLSGAAFRMGAESRAEFDEGFAPDHAYGELLGHSLYFYSKDTGRPVRFVPPAFALQDLGEIPRFRQFRAVDSGCRFWWLEYGGRLDTVHETETIKWELWKVAYGIWNYIKNSGRFPEAENLTLEWVGTIPGKRESRRFEGDVILKQQDVVEQRSWDDAVSFGGWAMDLHPADGVYSSLSACTQWHAQGVYEIPYRAMYSRNVRNLFLTGRLISVSHVAFGSTRVMATCGHNAQAVGMAAHLCRLHHLQPAELVDPARMVELQRALLRAGQHIPGVGLQDPQDLALSAHITATSACHISTLAPNGETRPLDSARGMLLPLAAGPVPAFTLVLDVLAATTLRASLKIAKRPGVFTPEVELACQLIPLEPGTLQSVTLAFDTALDQPQYAFVCLDANPEIAVHLSDTRLTGLLSVSQSMNAAVAKGARQEPPPGIGVDSFEFWLPERRPGGKNFALTVDPPLNAYSVNKVTNGVHRPTTETNAWVAALDDPEPSLTLEWDTPQTVAAVDLVWDNDFDHPLESVLMGHPECEIPFCVKSYRIVSENGIVLHQCDDNHETLNFVRLAEPVLTPTIRIDILETRGTPAALFALRCYGPEATPWPHR